MYTKNILMYRQGDLLLTAIERIPRTAKLQKTDVILEGEVTGHLHRLKNGKIFIGNDSWHRNQMYIDARNGKSYLSHEEHKRIDLQARCYIVTRQREYEPKTKDYELDNYYIEPETIHSFRWISD